MTPAALIGRLSDRDLALLCAATETKPAPTWTFAGPTFHAILTPSPDGPVLACEGSESLPDWFVDFDVIGHRIFDHPALGPIHDGFNRSTDECLPEIIKALYGTEPTVTGHSKGGAEGELLVCKLSLAGIKVKRLVTFGTPRWVAKGNTKIASMLPASLGLSYRHFKDIVTEVPPKDWDHPPERQPVEIGAGTLCQMLGAAWMHHISNYIASLPVRPALDAMKEAA